ncbi:unnamed protein product [Caenorhabditis auriculariae]|uniref:Uncharacterized protein n=1 Tax=Caenorhabditis auriculariae TaxID=2777116 RepID=A0A8S1HCS6_9PELO|nr:unnamed protein product [Caenorhabditis auriculariae]
MERSSPRSLAEQLRRFVQLTDAPAGASNGISLSDAGFVLLTLKDHILNDSPKAQHFAHEFISKPINGLELLSKVVIVLQGIVNSVQGSSSKISYLLSRNTSNTNRKRKAAVAEADCIECIKILLEKTEASWKTFLETSTGLDAILYSVHSPQLDSKCYSLEILLLLLDQPQGFLIFLRALTVLAARNREFLRLSVFVAQLKHGLHTNKLHIQILVVRLFNKLVANSPTQMHRALIKSEAALSQFTPEYVEKLIGYPNTNFGGLDVLLEELSLWKSMSTPQAYASTNVEHNHIYGLSEDGDSLSERTRRPRGNIKLPANTMVAKNVERQRFKKQGAGSGGRAAASNYYQEGTGPRATFNSDRRAHTLSHRGYGEAPSPISSSRAGYATERREPAFGAMRRAKSESAMIVHDREPLSVSPVDVPRGLKRFNKEQVHYHPIQQVKALSRSVHDLSVRDEDPSTLVRPSSARPPSVNARIPMRAVSPPPVSPIIRQEHEERTPRRMSSALSPRARFADPPTVEAQQPHAGFSYLFPQQPVVASVVPKRALSPEPQQQSAHRPLSAPLYARTYEVSSRPLSPSTPQESDYDSRLQAYAESGQVVYVPINMEGGRRLSKTIRYDLGNNYGPTDSRSSSRTKVRSPSINGTIGEDVRDALSQFDYLYDYDNPSPHKTREATYHL